MIKNVLFDLDGTLLPMDDELFAKYYFGLMAKKVAPLGYEPKKLVDSIWTGTAAMVKNDGAATNEEVFWNVFCSIYGEQVREHMLVFEDFYHHEFNGAKVVCGFNPKANELVQLAKSLGYRVVLATNPIFPRQGTLNRIDWAGLKSEDFELITTYENAHFSKPNPNYYKEIVEKLDLNPEECLMIGNDAIEDTAATKIGMKVFLITDTLLNKKNVDISAYPQGNMDDCMEYLRKMNVE